VLGRPAKGAMPVTESHRLFYRDFLSHDHAIVNAGHDETGWNIWESFRSEHCPNCSNRLSLYVHRPGVLARHPELPDNGSELVSYLGVCNACGWWQIKREAWSREGFLANWAYWYHGTIERVDFSSDDVALADVRAQLLKRREGRRLLSASKAEELVSTASGFKPVCGSTSSPSV
jgi:hypothetical protein